MTRVTVAGDPALCVLQRCVIGIDEYPKCVCANALEDHAGERACAQKPGASFYIREPWPGRYRSCGR